MKIKSKGGGPRTMHVRKYMPAGYVVEFDANGVADVDKDVGKALCAAYDGITPVRAKKKEGDK
jgi:hypothetical protein